MGYDVSCNLHIISKVSADKLKKIDEFIKNYFSELGDNYLMGTHAGTCFDWSTMESDMKEISSKFPTVKFLLTVDGEADEDYKFLIYKGGEILKEEDGEVCISFKINDNKKISGRPSEVFEELVHYYKNAEV